MNSIDFLTERKGEQIREERANGTFPGRSLFFMKSKYSAKAMLRIVIEHIFALFVISSWLRY